MAMWFHTLLRIYSYNIDNLTRATPSIWTGKLYWCLLSFCSATLSLLLFDIFREKLLHLSHICIDIWLHIWHQRAVLLCGMLSGVHLLISSCCLATHHLVTCSSSSLSFVSSMHIVIFKVIFLLQFDTLISISMISFGFGESLKLQLSDRNL